MSNERNISIAVVICAGGESKRFGEKKEYQKIDGDITVLGSAVKAFMGIDNIDVIAVAIPGNDMDAARASLPEEYLNAQKLKLIFTEGGNTRRASVYNALRELKEHNPEFVLIHDGARPWVSESLINNVIEAAQERGAVIPVLPLTDTPKEYDGVLVTRHLKRAEVCIAQTPQGFKFNDILQAHEKAALVNEEFTDDAEIWGRFLGEVAVVPGEPENKKITFKGDLI